MQFMKDIRFLVLLICTSLVGCGGFDFKDEPEEDVKIKEAPLDPNGYFIGQPEPRFLQENPTRYIGTNAPIDVPKWRIKRGNHYLMNMSLYAFYQSCTISRHSSVIRSQQCKSGREFWSGKVTPEEYQKQYDLINIEENFPISRFTSKFEQRSLYPRKTILRYKKILNNNAVCYEDLAASSKVFNVIKDKTPDVILPLNYSGVSEHSWFKGGEQAKDKIKDSNGFWIPKKASPGIMCMVLDKNKIGEFRYLKLNIPTLDAKGNEIVDFNLEQAIDAELQRAKEDANKYPDDYFARLRYYAFFGAIDMGKAATFIDEYLGRQGFTAEDKYDKAKIAYEQRYPVLETKMQSYGIDGKAINHKVKYRGEQILTVASLDDTEQRVTKFHWSLNGSVLSYCLLPTDQIEGKPHQYPQLIHNSYTLLNNLTEIKVEELPKGLQLLGQEGSCVFDTRNNQFFWTFKIVTKNERLNVRLMRQQYLGSKGPINTMDISYFPIDRQGNFIINKSLTENFVTSEDGFKQSNFINNLRVKNMGEINNKGQVKFFRSKDNKNPIIALLRVDSRHNFEDMVLVNSGNNYFVVNDSLEGDLVNNNYRSPIIGSLEK